MSPISATGDMEAKLGGGLVFSFRPSVIINVGVDLRGKQYINTDIELSVPGSIRFDAALSTSCVDGVKFDVSGKLGVDFSVSHGLPGWDSANYHWVDSTEGTIFSECVPFSVLAKRALEGNLVSRASEEPLELPESTRSTCAYSSKGVYCADDDDQEELDCNMNTLDSNTATEDAENELMRRGVLAPRNSKILPYCNTKGASGYEGFHDDNQGKIKFSNYPSSSELVSNYYPNAATYDAEDPNSCTNLNLVKLAKTPQQPSTPTANQGRKYDSEHILEGQVVQRFFNARGMAWSNKTAPTALANTAARKYPDPTKGAKDELAWCLYMQKWWQPEEPKNGKDETWIPNTVLGGEYPGYHWHYTDEMVLLEALLNQQVKQGWFSGNKLYHEKAMSTYIKKGQWSLYAKTLKAHILMWQYYNIDSIKKTLVKQANRIETKLKDLEDTEIMKNLGTKYDKPYISQGLSALWKEWVRSDHKRVESDVKKFLILWTKRAYDLNRPDDPKVNLQPGQMRQKNKAIVTVFEVYLAAVQNLQAWDIDWDMDTSDDDDGMDID
ncbi:hypothetical protein ASPCAL15011 [Aspergillus calidoustus]|uniref:Uncharacterized protein n=1 Tax=Aspergillus calidoustus TaxID=454130 RepID=A0A0U5GKM8_ASPCI|nr:hypothetical protein ASPCAL15011 [Aspergillus calidoustus]